MESSLYVYALKNVADADKSELKLVFVFSKRDNLSCRARVLTHAWKSAMHSACISAATLPCCVVSNLHRTSAQRSNFLFLMKLFLV